MVTRKMRSYPSLKHWRDAMGLTQREAAKTLGISQQTYTIWERREAPVPSRRVRGVMDKTHVPIEVLVGAE